MKKIYSFYTMLVLALVGLTLTSCSKDDLSTDQYGGDISLTAFGPCPVVRGGTLHLYGANLDQLASINLPGADPITAFEVIKAGAQSEITIQVPAEKCEPGQITLVTKKGGQIVSVSPITYREDFVFTSMYIGEEGNLNGSVGDVLTIKGDYMNLIQAIVFTDKATVDAADFVSQDRYTIQVAIPATAMSGTIMLTDKAETPLEYVTEQAITVALPVYESCEVAKWKAGETVVFKGKDLDQIHEIVFPGVVVDEGDFTVSADGTTLTCKMPDASSSGTIQLVTYSGVEIPAATVETVKPSNLAVDPSPVKNLGKLTISGTDLDLVSAISLPNSGALAADKWSYASDKITITEIPETAQEGDITLSMKGGESVNVAYKLIWPSITGCTAAATSREDITIEGTDLDLVASVKFPSYTEKPVVERAKFKEATETKIVVTVPDESEGTDLILNLKNGTTVSKEAITNILAVPFLTGGDKAGGQKLNATIKGINFNKIQSLYLGDTHLDAIVNTTNTEITFVVPFIATGVYKLTAEDFKGNKYDFGEFKVTKPEVTFWEGNVSTMDGWKNIENIGSDAGAELKAIDPSPGHILRIYADFADGWQMKFLEGHWDSQYWGGADPAAANPGDGLPAYDLDANGGCVKITITQAMLDAAYTQKWWGGTFIIQGKNFVLKKITVASE